jgi:two-component system sensor histidine kinase DegS
MIQEACNNILKHAEASLINIKLHYEPHSLSILVCDNGKGFNLEEVEQQRATNRSAGINNIRKRASLMQARVTIVSSPSCGTKLSLFIPIDKSNES